MNHDATPSALRFNGAVDPIEEERARLETDIALAKARLLTAKGAAAQLDAETKQALRAELALSREQLADVDRRHAESVEAIRAAAAGEVERVLADARRRVDELDMQAASVLMQVGA
jgi:hypothetical protein